MLGIASTIMIEISMRGPEKLEGRYRYDYVPTRNQGGLGCMHRGDIVVQVFDDIESVHKIEAFTMQG